MICVLIIVYIVLYNAILNDGVMVIDSGAFRGCRNLVAIFLPSSLIYIADNTFDECYNLKYIKYGGSMEQWCTIYHNESKLCKPDQCMVYCTDGNIKL